MTPCTHFDDDELVYICTGNARGDNEDEPCFFGDVYDMYDVVAMCFYCGREVPLECAACTPAPPDDETDTGEYTDASGTDDSDSSDEGGWESEGEDGINSKGNGDNNDTTPMLTTTTALVVDSAASAAEINNSTINENQSKNDTGGNWIIANTPCTSSTNIKSGDRFHSPKVVPNLVPDPHVMALLALLDQIRRGLERQQYRTKWHGEDGWSSGSGASGSTEYSDDATAYAPDEP